MAKKTTIFNAENYLKFALLIGTAFGSIFTGIFYLEDRVDMMIKKSIKEAIDTRLNVTLQTIEEHGTDLTLLKLAAQRSDIYISDNGYRLNYHERVMRDITSYLYQRPPHDFIKPDELRFEDFKEQKRN